MRDLVGLHNIVNGKASTASLIPGRGFVDVIKQVQERMGGAFHTRGEKVSGLQKTLIEPVFG